MTIRFHCEHCSKEVEAPDSAGGRRGKCPFCHGSNYIPAVEAAEEIPLAPLDEQEERLHQRELDNLRAAEHDLLTETTHTETGPRLTELDKDEVEVSDLYHLVINYCTDMADGNLERAETHVDRLKKFPGKNREAVDAFLSGKVLEPSLDAVPVRVLNGFLKNLMGELH